MTTAAARLETARQILANMDQPDSDAHLLNRPGITPDTLARVRDLRQRAQDIAPTAAPKDRDDHARLRRLRLEQIETILGDDTDVKEVRAAQTAARQVVDEYQAMQRSLVEQGELTELGLAKALTPIRAEAETRLKAIVESVVEARAKSIHARLQPMIPPAETPAEINAENQKVEHFNRLNSVQRMTAIVHACAGRDPVLRNVLLRPSDAYRIKGMSEAASRMLLASVQPDRDANLARLEAADLVHQDLSDLMGDLK